MDLPNGQTNSSETHIAVQEKSRNRPASTKELLVGENSGGNPIRVFLKSGCGKRNHKCQRSPLDRGKDHMF